MPNKRLALGFDRLVMTGSGACGSIRWCGRAGGGTHEQDSISTQLRTLREAHRVVARGLRLR